MMSDDERQRELASRRKVKRGWGVARGSTTRKRGKGGRAEAEEITKDYAFEVKMVVV